MILPRIEANIAREEGGCWFWVASRSGSGYGQASVNGRLVQVHRLVYEDARGAIPAGLTLDHLCRVRLCVNPAHLEPVSVAANVLRGEGITAVRARAQVCQYGHVLVADHRPKRKGHRWCPTCHAARNAKRPTTRKGRILASGGAA